MPATWVDILFVGVFIYFAFKGWTQGIIYLSASALAFAISLFLALRYAGIVSQFIHYSFGLDNRWAALVAYFVVAFSAELLISEMLSRLLQKAPGRMFQGNIHHALGAFVSATSGLFLVSLFIFILLLVPIRGTIKDDIRASFIAPKILSVVELYGGPLPTVLKKSAKELTQFMTVKSNSTESIQLDVTVDTEDIQVDYETEDNMIVLVNNERKERGIEKLRVNQSLTDVARGYARRMLLERFFSHYDSQGLDVSKRLEDGGIRFLIAGENLAYAPDLSSAHEGLMNSEGHKKNILDTRFHRVGIGVVDAGIWGKMFVQVFSD